MHPSSAVAALVVLLATACADKPAEPAGPPIGKHVLRPGEPPMEAFAACYGKAVGITCAIGYRHGVCAMPESGEPRPACLTEGAPSAGPSPSR